MPARRPLPPKLAACPIRDVLDRVSGRWSMLVLTSLGRTKIMRFTALKREIGDISQRMLAQTLRELEQDGYVSRHVYPTIPPRVEYALTPLGKTLLKSLSPLIDWALANNKKVDAARAAYRPPQATTTL